MASLLKKESDPYNIKPLMEGSTVNNLCECEEFHKNIIFGNKCSKCYERIHPDIWIKLNKKDNYKISLKNRKYHYKYLENFTKMRQLPENNFMWKTLKQMYSDGSIMQNKNLLTWLDYLKKNTQYQGISVKQAVELTLIYKNSPENYVTEINKYRLQHSICGMVIDWWNLPKKQKIIGGISCYYDGSGILPLINTKIKGASTFMDHCHKETCDNYKKKNLCDINHYSTHYIFWINNFIKKMD